jgi:hypothetical protein
MPAARYSELIDPANVSVRCLLGEATAAVADPTSADGGQALERLLRLLRGFRYVNASGLTSLDEAARTRAGNCLSLVCLLCSLLRASGLDENQVFASVGCPRGFHLTEMHAYVILRESGRGRLSLIDPRIMRAGEITVNQLCSEYSIFVAFNDQVQESGDDEIRSLLSDLPVREEVCAGRSLR